MEKEKRNQLLTTLADINDLAEKLESKVNYKEQATDEIHQLLKCYELRIDILKII